MTENAEKIIAENPAGFWRQAHMQGVSDSCRQIERFRPMRVLIACEFSGVVRDAFSARGHDATSCDLLPSETVGKHIVGDVLPLLSQKWDLMIAHPPCTYLCNSGVCWLVPHGVLNKKRHAQMMAACDFFAALYWSDIPRLCVENPIMHKYARNYLGNTFHGWHHENPKPSQIIQPWQFGHGETKATCLWLRGLPPLKQTNVVSGRKPRSHFESPSPERWKNRSRTLLGIAAAMAEQWTP
jgi:hypothetical protein